MSDAKDQHEPSMEEILASIRRIISEDDEAQAPAEGAADAAAPPPAAPPPAAAAPAAPAPTAKASAAPAPAPAAAPAAAPAPRPKLIEDVETEDVLLLTEEVPDEAPLAPPAPEEESPLAIEMDDDEPPPEPPRPPPREAEPDPVFAAVNEPPPPPPAPARTEEDDRLLSQRAAAASLAAMSELVTRSHRDPDIESLPMGQANQTLEDITRELLRPILKSWLDDNLPQIVERIVREEIGRLAIDAQRR